RLRLSVVFEDGVLVVHVTEAKALVGNDQGKCNCYVKVGLAPDSDAGTRRKTKTVPDCRSPLFQETFFFDVTDEDEKKKKQKKKKRRLLFTVWNCDGAIRQLVGCMSFGVCSLVRSQKISGWYYLLGEDLGRTKHLRVDPLTYTHTS
ncbi:regulator of G-protein signaling 3a isoform X11, partial [Tachysurus ichikawai]